MRKPPKTEGYSLKYNKIILLKDGRECCLRNGTENDAQEVLDVFNLTHAETDYLLTYPDENSFTVEQEGAFLKAKTESSNEIEIIAVVDGKIAGTAGIDALGNKYKTKHRAEFGIGIAREFWGLGIGRALTEACIEPKKPDILSWSSTLSLITQARFRFIKKWASLNTEETRKASIRV